MFRDKYLKQVSLGYYLALSTDASVDESTPRASALHHGDVSFVSRRTRLTCMQRPALFSLYRQYYKGEALLKKISKDLIGGGSKDRLLLPTEKCLSAPASFFA
jgi:hypothetical protein